MRQHIDLLGIVWMALGALSIVMGVLMALLYGGLGAMSVASGGDEGVIGGAVMGGVALLIGALSCGFGAGEILVGVGLRRRRPWGRLLAMLMGAFQLLSIPIGTLVGAFTIYVLLQDDVAAEFKG